MLALGRKGGATDHADLAAFLVPERAALITSAVVNLNSDMSAEVRHSDARAPVM